MFLGYPEGVKGYKVWLLEEKKCVTSRDVRFNEGVFYKAQNQDQPDTDTATTTGVENGANTEDQVSSETPNTDQGGAAEEDLGAVSGNEEEDQAFDTFSDDIDPHAEQLGDYVLARDRERRVSKPNARYAQADLIAFALVSASLISGEEPSDLNEAKRCKEWPLWKKAMQEEMDSLHKNQTWDIVKRPEKKRIVGSKWIFKLKPGIPGVESARFKAKLVAKGFSQVEGVDYHEVFSPVVKHTSIRILLSLTAMFDLELEQLDVKTAFLHGKLDEQIYMQQPEEFIAPGDEEKVCLLKKSLYGLKQSPRQWYLRFDLFMFNQGFIRSKFDSCVYITKLKNGNYMYLLIYVDDMLIACKDKFQIQKLKDQLSSEFDMKDLGPASKILGMNIERDRDKGILRLSQKSYLEKVARSFGLDKAKAVSTPIGAQFKLMSLTEQELDNQAKYMEKIPYSNCVGSLMYGMISTRPDIAYGVSLVSRFMSKPGKTHWEAAKWLVRYIKGASDLSLVYTSNQSSHCKVQGYCDSDYAGDLDKRRSLSGYVFTVGENTVSWKASLQHVVALSTTEAEYISLTEAVKEGLWLKGFMSELGYDQDCAEIYCDSQSAIHLSKNTMYHERTKHIDVRLHFIRDIIAEGVIKVKKICTDVNPADILTKVVPIDKFRNALDLLKLRKG